MDGDKVELWKVANVHNMQRYIYHYVKLCLYCILGLENMHYTSPSVNVSAQSNKKRLMYILYSDHYSLMSVSPSQGHEYIFAFPLLDVTGQSSSPSHSLWLPWMCFNWYVGWVLNVLWSTDESVPPAFHSGRPTQLGGRWMLTFQKIKHVDRL